MYSPKILVLASLSLALNIYTLFTCNGKLSYKYYKAFKLRQEDKIRALDISTRSPLLRHLGHRLNRK